MKMQVVVSGAGELRRKLKEAGVRGVRAVGRALYQEGEQIMAVSKADWVPVKDGILRSSGHVRLPNYEGGGVSVTLGFGGAASAYSIPQHERLDYWHKGQGRAKYLEIPTVNAASGMGRRVGIAVANDMRRLRRGNP